MDENAEWWYYACRSSIAMSDIVTPSEREAILQAVEKITAAPALRTA